MKSRLSLQTILIVPHLSDFSIIKPSKAALQISKAPLHEIKGFVEVQTATKKE